MTHLEPPRPNRPLLLALAFVALGATLVAGCGETAVPSSPPTTNPTPAASPSSGGSASPVASDGAASTACSSTDLRVTGGPWGGAAGSRGTDIVVTNRGSSNCVLPAGPVVAILDATGGAVLQSGPASVGQGPEIAPNASIGFSALVGNWCDATVALPLRFELALAVGSIGIDDVTVAGLDELPPCNGPGLPATLTVTPWVPR